MPACRQWSSFGFAIADNTNCQQIRIVKHRTIRVRQRVTEFAAFVDRSGSLGRDVTGNSAGKGKLLEQLLHSHFVLRNIGIELAVSAFEVRVSNQTGTTMTRTGYIDHIQVTQLDRSVQVNVDEIQAG